MTMDDTFKCPKACEPAEIAACCAFDVSGCVVQQMLNQGQFETKNSNLNGGLPFSDVGLGAAAE